MTSCPRVCFLLLDRPDVSVDGSREWALGHRKRVHQSHGSARAPLSPGKALAPHSIGSVDVPSSPAWGGVPSMCDSAAARSSLEFAGGIRWIDSWSDDFRHFWRWQPARSTSRCEMSEPTSSALGLLGLVPRGSAPLQTWSACYYGPSSLSVSTAHAPTASVKWPHQSVWHFLIEAPPSPHRWRRTFAAPSDPRGSVSWSPVRLPLCSVRQPSVTRSGASLDSTTDALASVRVEDSATRWTELAEIPCTRPPASAEPLAFVRSGRSWR